MNKRYYYFVSYSVLVKNSPVNPITWNSEIMRRAEILSIEDIRTIEQELINEFNKYSGFQADIASIISYQPLRVEDIE